MTYNHRKHSNDDDSDPELRNATVSRSGRENEKKVNLRPRHVVIGNACKGLTSKNTVENIETTKTDEIESSGDNNTVKSGGVASGSSRETV